MGTAEEARQAKALEGIERHLRVIARVAETMNENLVAIGKDIKAHLQSDVDLDELEQYVRRLRQLKEDDTGHGFKLDQKVGISEPAHAFFGYEGTIVTLLPENVRVMFKGIEGYSIFTYDEITPAV